MIRYGFQEYQIVNSGSDNNEVEIMLILTRKYMMYMATTFLPTMSLILIAELTLFIDTSHFEATIMVALTAMLVMYTLYQSVTDSLPATSYLKMIDIWLLAGLILPFVIILILVIVDNKNGGIGISATHPQPVQILVGSKQVDRSKSTIFEVGEITNSGNRILKQSRRIIVSFTFGFAFVFFSIGLLYES